MKKKFIIFNIIFLFIFINAKKYKVNEFKNVIIYSWPSINKKKVDEINYKFDLVFKTISNDLEYPDNKPKIFIYESSEDLYNELINTWKYSSWLKQYNSFPRMNKKYEMWMLLLHDIKFMAHEYTHRIVEQIAGLNSQIYFKWFDEGFAEYEGIKVLSLYDPVKAKSIKAQYYKILSNLYKSKTLTNINNMTTENQWTNGIKLYQNKYYIQSYALVDFLIKEYGLEKIKDVLELKAKNNSFSDSFRGIYKISIEKFEKKFLLYIKNIK
jgi:hypothetical protein